MWNVIGHDRAVELLRHSLESDRLAHAYIFVGTAHVGKKTLAVNLAQALNCEREESPCGECRSCLRIAQGIHPDVQVIERVSEPVPGETGPKKNITISQIRDLQQAAGLRPFEGRHRVFIIDSAEYLNDESANCLLKTLEEPPPNVCIIVLAINDTGLLPTIISRCQRIELFPIAANLVEQSLIDRWQVVPANAKTLSRICRGRIGWAISAANDDAITEERSLNLARLHELTSASLKQRFDFAADMAEQFGKNRDLVVDMLNLWRDWWRDLLLVKEGCGQFIINIDSDSTLEQQAQAYSLADIRSFIDSIQASIRQLEQNVNARLVIEVLMLSIPVKDVETAHHSGARER